MENFGPAGALSAQIELSDPPAESMVICTPFDKKGHFYFNQKINCLRAAGEVSYGGRIYRFDPEESFAVLDWGRGVWTYHNTWYWGSASGAVDGAPFGWNIGYGFGDCSAATENMLFHNGKAHKLSRVNFHIPGGEKDFLSPWTFDSRGELMLTLREITDMQRLVGRCVCRSGRRPAFPGRISPRSWQDGRSRPRWRSPGRDTARRRESAR